MLVVDRMFLYAGNTGHFRSVFGTLLRFLCWFHDTAETTDMLGGQEVCREEIMEREKEYRQLANDALQRVTKEENALLRAQWEILGARYTELAEQSTKLDENATQYDPIPWDRTRGHRQGEK